MPLDFHNADDNELIFSLDETQFMLLNEILAQYFYRTGMQIDYYQDQALSVANQQTLAKIINAYIQTTDLNRNKNKTLAIIEFLSYLKFCTARKWDLVLLAD